MRERVRGETIYLFHYSFLTTNEPEYNIDTDTIIDRGKRKDIPILRILNTSREELFIQFTCYTMTKYQRSTNIFRFSITPIHKNFFYSLTSDLRQEKSNNVKERQKVVKRLRKQ